MSKVHNIITEQIIKQLEKAIESKASLPWRKPWTIDSSGLPMSLNTGKPYRGINSLMLGFSPFTSAYWLTAKQVKARGGSINRGESYSPVIFFNWIESKDGSGDKFPMLRFYKVWNVEQCEGIDYPKPETVVKTSIERISSADKLVKEYIGKPPVKPSSQASYSPSADTVQMPPIETFESSEFYYSTLFHEFVHSTGHENRVNRKTITELNRFGSHEYSKEELIAELGASILCQHCGIDNDDTRGNSLAYIRGWIKALKDDVTLAVKAGQQAQKAVDHILGVKFDNKGTV